MPTLARALQTAAALATLMIALAACGGSDDPAAEATPSGTPATVGTRAERGTALARAEEVQAAVSRWATAADLPAAQAAAEDARNLLTGPHVEGLGDLDADGDGQAESVERGLLPGDDGAPGLATPLAAGCVETDVLGGSWDDPKARWDAAVERIDDWRPNNNTFPGFPSHAQRVVGWATLTLDAETLDEAREYAGHAGGHAAVVTAALKEPGAAPCPGG